MEPVVDKIIRSRRRSISLRVTWDAQVVIRVPYGFDRARIHGIIRTRRTWILRKLAFVRTIEKSSLSSRLESGCGLPFLGREYPVREVPSCEQVRFQDGFYLSDRLGRQTEAVLGNWYRDRAAELVAERMSLLAQRLPGTVWRSVSVGNARSRMGSCDSSGNIMFSWRLAAAPPEIIDYVVAHEMAHLVHLNHSGEFWKLVESLCPRTGECRSWLRKNSHRLLL